jgi:hypothetical protein
MDRVSERERHELVGMVLEAVDFENEFMELRAAQMSDNIHIDVRVKKRMSVKMMFEGKGLSKNDLHFFSNLKSGREQFQLKNEAYKRILKAFQK